MKNIVLCSDGTAASGGKARGTNVWTVFRALKRDDRRIKQVAFYDDGVGTQKFILWRALGGAFGFGVNRNIRELYTALVRNYDPGDRIYLFGFSRGAYTVRALAGLIGLQGILKRDKFQTSDDLHAAVGETFSTFRQRFRHKTVTRDPDTHNGKVHFMGVWDTVDAVGMPVDEMADALDKVWPFRFPDFKLGSYVDRACHVVSIDDERHTFHPVLWDEEDEGDSDRIEQVWFAGVHTNVGGGYPKDQMAYVTLKWMLRRAVQAGLRFDDDLTGHFTTEADVNGKLYDSRAGVASYYRYAPREIADLAKKANLRKIQIHESVFDRIGRATLDYAPAWIPPHAEIVDDNGDVVERVQECLTNHPPNLTAAQGTVPRRKLLHLFFVVYTLSLVGLAVRAWWIKGELHVGDGWLSWLKPFLPDIVGPALDYAQLNTLWTLGLLLVLLILFWLRGRWGKLSTRTAMDGWRGFREAL